MVIRVRAGSVTRAGDQRGAKACGLCSDGVPDMGGDHHAVAGSDIEFLGNQVIDVRGGLVGAATFDAELSFDEVA